MMKGFFKVIASGTMALAISACAGTAQQEIFVPEGYELLWSDEFDGDSLNTANWTPEYGGHGWGNNELQFYTGRKENVDVKDGRLVMTARKEDYNGSPVTSARLITLGKFEFRYGYVVASIKLPKTVFPLSPKPNESFFSILSIFNRFLTALPLPEFLLIISIL